MEKNPENDEINVNVKQRRRLFGRKDRFLMKEFGQDITKKLKSMSKSANPSNQLKEKLPEPSKKEEKEENKEEESGQSKVLKNKRYEIKYSDKRVEEFIKNLRLADQEPFLNVPRKPCPKCKRNSHLYCPECLLPVIAEDRIPRVPLPFPLTILWHEQEKKSKSSALPLTILLAPKDVKVVPFPSSPVTFDEDSTVFLYPHKNSRMLSEFSGSELAAISTVVAIECTWNQTNGILKELKNTGRKYKYVRLADYDTFFWRHQRHAEKCLATCEAIYYFFREFEEARRSAAGEEGKYDGKYDNLLFYYLLQFKTILNAID